MAELVRSSGFFNPFGGAKMNPVKVSGPQVQITKDGPYIVSGAVLLSKKIIGTNQDGESTTWEPGQKYPPQKQYALCRCGHSSNKPFCDGSHLAVGFDGTETAQRLPYLEQAKTLRGPSMSLTDVESLCSSARFCDPHGSVRTSSGRYAQRHQMGLAERYISLQQGSGW